MTSTPAMPMTVRDTQRRALEELIRLASECVAMDAAIARTQTSATSAADKLLKQQAASITGESLEKLSTLQAARTENLSKIETEFIDAKAAADKQYAESRRSIQMEFDGTSGKLRKEYQDAVWLSESVMDSAVHAAEKTHTDTITKSGTDRTAVDELRDAVAVELHRYGQQHLLNEPEVVPEVTAAAFEFESSREDLRRRAASMATLRLPRLFVGAWPFVIGVVIVAGAVAATQPWARNLAVDWQAPAYAAIAAIVCVVAAGFVVARMAAAQVRRCWHQFSSALARTHSAIDQRLIDSKQTCDAAVNDAQSAKSAEVARINGQFHPMMERVKARRHDATAAAEAMYQRLTTQAITRHDEKQMATRLAHESSVKQIEDEKDQALFAAQSARDREVERAGAQYNAARRELVDRWDEGLRHTQEQSSLQTAPGCVRFGSLAIDLSKIAAESVPEVELHNRPPMRLIPPPPYAVPAWLAMPSQSSLMIEHDREQRESAIELLRATVFSLLHTLPAGRCKFTFVDPVGLGQSFAAFMHLADYDDSLVGGRIWSEQDQIERRLADLTEHMETVIQTFLRNEFATIDEYNAQAGELAEPYRFLVIADCPTNFSDEALRRLANVATTGARCGVYVLMSRDSRVTLASPTLLDDLRKSCTVISQHAGRFVWGDAVFRRFAFEPARAPADEQLTARLHEIGKAARDSKRVEVPFSIIAAGGDDLWTRSTSADVSVPVGRTGATRLQSFRLGKGVAQHALIAGKTGSGKSTLLNILITNLSMWYSPDELEYYLIDFKRGVEFKAYATYRLPHARAIAIESDREFGLSVLQRLDAEIARRGELYRQSSVQDVASFRAANPGVRLPRVLLIIDEFQELFSEDDKLAQEAALLMDRLVRQGRAFGIHLILGSQTIGGSATLPRTTIGQMAVRVALQCTEADSQLILGDNNSAARLLSRPGEAIYNDAGGAVEANSPFQICWLSDHDREMALRQVADLARDRKVPPMSVTVFEGNAPARIEDNTELLKQFRRWDRLTEVAPTLSAMIGEAVAIKPPSHVLLRQRAGANVLITGQQEEQALAVLSSMAISIVGQVPGKLARFVLLDATPADSVLYQRLGSILRQIPAEAREVEFRDAGAAVVELAAELERRRAGELPLTPVALIINGLQRYRDLRRTEESFSFSLDSGDAPKPVAADKAFVDLLREGPAVGIYVLVWVDTLAALDRTLERSVLREFDHRVLFQMSAADSSTLIDSPAANKLGSFRAIYYSEELGVIEKFRPYEVPTDAYLKRLTQSATS